QTRSEIFAALVGSLYFLLRVRSHRKLFVIFSGVAVLVVSLAWVEIGPRLLPQGTDILTDLFPEKVASSMVTTVEAGDVEGTGASIAGAGVGTGDVEGTGASIAGAGVGTGDVEGTGASGVGAGVGTGDTESARASDVGDIETALDQWSETKVRWYDRENPRNDTAITLSNRIGKWTLGAQYFLERPLMGFGFGTEDQLFDLYGMRPVEYVYTGTYFHNSYLGLALQLGLMGAVLFYLPLGLLVSREIRFANRPPPDLMRTALMAVVLTGMVSGLFSSDLYSMGNPKTVSFWICVMLLQRCNHSPVVNSDVGGLLGRTTRQYKC
ncbi:MAG TPA: O-antigen ligase family protein, partial [Anaerolineales bacterium]|nr:O-antigen ligase family protein [Anaerolineales bacterium]